MSATVLHPREQAGGFWVCPSCSTLNLPDATICERPRCGEPKPPHVEQPADRAASEAA